MKPSSFKFPSQFSRSYWCSVYTQSGQVAMGRVVSFTDWNLRLSREWNSPPMGVEVEPLGVLLGTKHTQGLIS